MPFLLGLAAGANVGSAATLIGNPQNALIGQTLDLSFTRFLLDAGVPAALGLVAVWAVIRAMTRGRWQRQLPRLQELQADAPAFDRWQAARGLLVLGVLVVAFLVGRWPRDLLALGAGGAALSLFVHFQVDSTWTRGTTSVCPSLTGCRSRTADASAFSATAARGSNGEATGAVSPKSSVAEATGVARGR